MLVAIAGPAGVGKDTVGAWFKAQGYATYAFAEPLRAGMAAMGFPEPRDRRDKESVVQGFEFTWRRGIQTLGTEWGRSLDPDIWTKVAERVILQHPKLAITDLRFPNELAMLRDYGATIIHMRGRGVEMGDNSRHVSEVRLPVGTEDIVIHNTGTIKQLHDILEGLFL